MPILESILQQKSEISMLVKAFGFTNPRIVCDDDDDELQIVVNNDPEQEAPYNAALQAALIDKLKCQVSIIDEDSIKELYKSSILEKCASLDNADKIKVLYGMPLSKIEIREPDSDLDSKAFLKRARPLVDMILKGKNINLQVQDESKSYNSKRKPESDINDRSKFIRVLLDSNNKAILEKVLLEMPVEIFANIENIYKNVSNDKNISGNSM